MGDAEVIGLCLAILVCVGLAIFFWYHDKDRCKTGLSGAGAGLAGLFLSIGLFRGAQHARRVKRTEEQYNRSRAEYSKEAGALDRAARNEENVANVAIDEADTLLVESLRHKKEAKSLEARAAGHKSKAREALDRANAERAKRDENGG